jgi:hypothetical protein
VERYLTGETGNSKTNIGKWLIRVRYNQSGTEVQTGQGHLIESEIEHWIKNKIQKGVITNCGRWLIINGTQGKLEERELTESRKCRSCL